MSEPAAFRFYFEQDAILKKTTSVSMETKRNYQLLLIAHPNGGKFRHLNACFTCTYVSNIQNRPQRETKWPLAHIKPCSVYPLVFTLLS